MCRVLVVVDLALVLVRKEGEAAYIQVVEVHHDLAAPPLVLLLVPSSCLVAAHPSSYPEAVDPLDPDQMDKAFVQRQDVLEEALAWDHRGPSSLEELSRDTSCSVVAEAFLGPLVVRRQGADMNKA